MERQGNQGDKRNGRKGRGDAGRKHVYLWEEKRMKVDPFLYLHGLKVKDGNEID